MRFTKEITLFYPLDSIFKLLVKFNHSQSRYVKKFPKIIMV